MRLRRKALQTRGFSLAGSHPPKGSYWTTEGHIGPRLERIGHTDRGPARNPKTQADPFPPSDSRATPRDSPRGRSHCPEVSAWIWVPVGIAAWYFIVVLVVLVLYFCPAARSDSRDRFDDPMTANVGYPAWVSSETSSRPEQSSAALVARLDHPAEIVADLEAILTEFTHGKRR